MRNLITTLVFSLVVGTLGAAPAFAGYYVEHRAEMPNPMTQQPMVHTIRSWHDGKKFRRDNPMRNEAVIIDLDKQMVVGVNDEAKTYWELPVARYEKLALVSLIVMGVQMNRNGTITVPDNLLQPTGRVEKIEGKTAYEVAITGKMPVPGMTTHFWLSEEVDLPMEKMLDEIRIALNNPKGPEYKKLFDQWRELRGYPVQSVTTVMTPKGEMTTRETLVTYRKETIPASTFLVPKGYAKTVDPITQLEGLQKQFKEQMEQRKAQQGATGDTPMPPPSGKPDDKRVLPRKQP